MEHDRLPHSCGRCTRRWTGTSAAHCTACHVTFTGITNFDRHRSEGRCRPPEVVGLVEKVRAGYTAWGRPADDVNHWEETDE